MENNQFLHIHIYFLEIRRFLSFYEFFLGGNPVITKKLLKNASSFWMQ